MTRPLRQMTLYRPQDHESLLRLKGVGESKLRRFGDQFIAAIANHVSANEGKQVGQSAPAVEPPAAWGGLPGGSPNPTAVELTGTATPAGKLLSRVLSHPVALAIESSASQRHLHREIGKALATLREREAYIVSHRFGLEDGRDRTLQEIGRVLRISGERVRQIEKKALRKLRHPSRLGQLEALLETHATPGNASGDPHRSPPCRAPEPGSYIAQVRESHARAYERWSAREDQQLKDLSASGQSVDEIASTLQRQHSAIRARLGRLGITAQNEPPRRTPGKAPSGRVAANQPSLMRTLEFIREGLTIAQIARRRRIAEDTVIGHLEQLTDEGNVPDFSHLMPESPRYERIAQAFIEVDSKYLTPVKEALGEDYSYEELRLVRFQMRQSAQGNPDRAS